MGHLALFSDGLGTAEVHSRGGRDKLGGEGRGGKGKRDPESPALLNFLEVFSL